MMELMFASSAEASGESKVPWMQDCSLSGGWYGPIVMNTQEQLRQAFDELEEGTFLKR